MLARRKKMPILISTDSTSDLPKHLLEKYQIAVMPFRVCTEGGEFLDGIEAETEGILSYMNEQGKSAQSEPPDVKDYEEFFAEQLTNALTHTYPQAQQAAQTNKYTRTIASKIPNNPLKIFSIILFLYWTIYR